MAKPRIGITTYNASPEQRINLPCEYVEAVVTANAIPYLIPPTNLVAAEIMHGLDGLILSGGGDIHPSLYDGLHHETLYNMDHVRDAAEFELAKYIIKNKIPCLAICRGAQMINVVQGGNLHEHLVDHFGEKVLHRQPPRTSVTHRVHVESNSKLSTIVGSKTISVSSWHHQSIKQLGKDLKVVATAEDGVIEAIEMQSHPWLLGVQWHPEHTAVNDPIQQQIFNAFIEFTNLKN